MRSYVLTQADRTAVLGIARAYAPVDEAAFAALMAHMRGLAGEPGAAFIRAGDVPATECFVLSGLVRTWAGDEQGRSVTLDFHEGPCALTPSLVRTVDGRSRVHCEALTPVRLVLLDAQCLAEHMATFSTVQCWGDAVLRAELLRRAQREWNLAVLSARERLLACRTTFADLEARVPHKHLASYLGMTPVSLSRLRSQLRGPVGRPSAPATEK